VAARDAELQSFIDAVAGAMTAVAGAPSAASIIFEKLAAKIGEPLAPPPSRLDVCRYLDTAYANAETASPSLGAVARAFAVVAPRLAWYARDDDDDAFRHGHANAYIVGERGLEQHPDVAIGATLMAPGITYPDHHHPPEEVYLVLGAGEWWNAETPWHAPGPGGLVHNPPGIVHAMRATEAPLFAVWCMLAD